MAILTDGLSIARSVWLLSNEEMVEHMCANRDENPKNWLFAMNKSLSHGEFMRMIVTLWAIWSASWKGIHEKEHIVSLELFYLNFKVQQRLNLQAPEIAIPSHLAG
jgi:hypothetical protein